jgi:hypothetical protein
LTTEAAFVEVQRDFDGFVDCLRSYKVVIDGAVVGQLGPGDHSAFEVAPGSHEIFLKIDWCRSEKVDVHLAGGQNVKFYCAPRANLFTTFYWITFGRHRYIRLSQVTA